MGYTFDIAGIKGAKTFEQLRDLLVRDLPRFLQYVRLYEPPMDLPYGPLVRPNGDTTRVQVLEITDGNDFTLANPDRPREGAGMILDFWNNTGGSMGTVTFGADYRLADTFAPAPSGAHATYVFAWMPN